MPSNLKKVGANAHLSIPIGSADYAKPVQKNHLEAIFRRDGCHHCGECVACVCVLGNPSTAATGLSKIPVF